MTIRLGFEPQRLTVILASGGDFVASLVSDSLWPSGVGIELRFSGGSAGLVTWAAEISGTRASWDVDADDVRELIGKAPTLSRLVYTEQDGSAILWAKGGVSVH